MAKSKIRIGTRASALALAQTSLICDCIREKLSNVDIEIVHITTSGDKKQGTEKASHGDKKDWILELELAILRGEIDMAVHSGKDVPADIEPGTAIAAVLSRAEPRDAFVGKRDSKTGDVMTVERLPQGAFVGTASLRRRAQLLRMRPDLQVVEHRGNVPTRLEKLEKSDTLSGIVLAAAGLRRLGYDAHITSLFDKRSMLPAVNQGILAIQYRDDDSLCVKIAIALRDESTFACWEAERGCVEVLGADCNSAVCVFAEWQSGNVELTCRVLSQDGSVCVEVTEQGSASEAFALGRRVAERAVMEGGRELL